MLFVPGDSDTSADQNPEEATKVPVAPLFLFVHDIPDISSLPD
jgi:hypothetical protein